MKAGFPDADLPWSVMIMVWALGMGSLAGNQSDGNDFFEARIRPLLEDSCIGCHGIKSGKTRGDLALDSKDGWQRGGAGGPVIIPGHPEASRLYQAVSGSRADFRMPPEGPPLSPVQVENIRLWIEMGAPDPRSEGTIPQERKSPREHWAFIKPVKPALPGVKRTDWPRQPMDYFILSKLEESGMGPSGEADPRTLLRRLFYDLIGLPPDWKDVEAFAFNPSEAAWNAWIERLLASPQYGERWARHWLDVARYADTKGYVFEEERSYAYAYTFRDYVIQAFNSDKPYNRFIREQLAADFMDLAGDKSPLAAMGYLTLGRRFLNNPHDIIDDRIDVVTRGMMGLTVGCARCHDHKYDPIPIEDYYSFYGIFASSMEPEEKPNLGDQNLPDSYPQFLEAKSVAREKLEDFVDSEVKRIRSEALEQASKYLDLALRLVGEPGEGKRDSDQSAREARLHPPVLRKWLAYVDRLAVQPDHPFALALEAAAHPQVSFLEKQREWLEARSNASLPAEKQAGLVQLREAGLKDLHELTEFLGGICGRLHAETPDKDVSFQKTDWDHWFPFDGSPFEWSEGEAIRLFDVKAGQNRRRLQRELDKLDAEHPGAPPRAMVLFDRPAPVEARVFIRGNPSNPGDPVPRKFLDFLLGPNREETFTNGSGRLELAEKIADTENPLTARVMVNRIWMHHFGRPLVETPSDFGMRAEPPSHPRLLDYLAIQFMEQGWSVKDLHRSILKSAAYRQSSLIRDDCHSIDPENRLLWRMNKRRLDFESMRDSVLAVSRELDLKVGGKSVTIHDQPMERRRSLYAHIDRQNLPGLFRTFDLANPDTSSPGRFSTTVPQQGLYLLNSAFMAHQSRLTAARVMESKGDPSMEGVLDRLFQRVYQRNPTQDEIRMMRDFHESASSDEVLPGPQADSTPLNPLEQIAHSLLVSNEFFFID